MLVILYTVFSFNITRIYIYIDLDAVSFGTPGQCLYIVWWTILYIAYVDTTAMYANNNGILYLCMLSIFQEDYMQLGAAT